MASSVSSGNTTHPVHSPHSSQPLDNVFSYRYLQGYQLREICARSQEIAEFYFIFAGEANSSFGCQQET